MARRLLVEIIGDASSLERSFGKASVATEGFGAKIGGLAKTAGLAAGAAALGGLTILLDKSIKLALAGQVSQAKLDTALKATHQSLLKTKPALDAAEASARKFGFTDDQARESLAKLEIATGNTQLSIKDLGVAEDIARFKHVDLTTASQMLAMAMTGSQRAIKQLGLTVIPVTANVDKLKASHEDLTTAVGRADLAQAKLMDKMATGKDIIQAVSDKVKGQADAYSKTAEGGMATFSANITHMEEELGNKLLPILNAALQWVNSHWPQITQVFKQVGDACGPILQALGQAVTTIVSTIKSNWSSISPVVNAVIGYFRTMFTNIAAVVRLIADIFHGDWSKAWDEFKGIVSRAFNALVNLIGAEAELFGRLALGLGKAILNGIIDGLQALGGLVLNLLSKLGDLIAKAAVLDAQAGLGLGKDIVNAIWKGLSGLAGLVIRGLSVIAGAIGTAAIDAANAAANLGADIVNGIINGISSLPGKLASKLTGFVGGAINTVKNFIESLSPSKKTAREIGRPLAEGVLQGWIEGTANLPNSMTQKMQDAINHARTVVDNARSSFAQSFGNLQSVADQMFQGISSSMQTPSGKKLAALVSAHDTQALVDQVTAAQTALAAAQAGGDPATILAAQQQLNDALYQQQIAALQKQADAEQKNLTARNAVRQIAFDRALGQLQDFLGKDHVSEKKAMSSIEALLRTYGVTFGNVGADMGTAWVSGLKDAITTAAAHSGLIGTVIKMEADSIKIPKAATGGYVSATGLAIIHRGETIKPAGRGGGGGLTIMPGALIVHALDPSSAATAVVEAITVWERQNGQRYQRA